MTERTHTYERFQVLVNVRDLLMKIPRKRIHRSCLPCCQTEVRQEKMVKRKSLSLCFLWKKKTFPAPQSWQLMGKEKNIQWSTGIVDCVLLGPASWTWDLYSHSEPHLKGFHAERCHLGILNKFSTGDPRFLLFTGPKKLGSRFCSSLRRVSSA